MGVKCNYTVIPQNMCWVNVCEEEHTLLEIIWALDKQGYHGLKINR